MKIGVSLYSFHEYTRPDKLGMRGCIDMVKQLGAEGIDIVEDVPFPTQEEYIAHAAGIGAYCREVGIEAVSFDVGSDFLNGSGGDVDAEIERVKKLVDVAAAYGCKFMRHDATPGYPSSIKTNRSFDAVLPRLTYAYKSVTEYAKTKGVKTCIENHGHFAQDALRVEKLVNAVGDENFGWLVDIGNFVCADEDPVRSVGIAAPYAVHAHAKDFHIKSGTQPFPGEGWGLTRGGNYRRGAIIGQGNVPVTQCIKALKMAGYDGYLMIEFEGMEDPLKGIRIGVDNLKRFIGEM